MTLAGILLHESILSSYVFKVFALIVAFNTLIYLGLTVSKFFPWPHQIGPKRVRTLLNLEHEEPSMIDSPTYRSTEETYEQARQAAAVRSASAAFALLEVLLVAVGLLSLLFLTTTRSITDVSTMAFGLAALVCSVVFSRSHLRDRTAIWAWVVISVLFVADQSWQLKISQNPLGVAGICVVLVLIPAIALSWLPGLLGGAVGLALGATSAIVAQRVESLPALAVIVASFFAGVILMYLRMTSIDEATSDRLLRFAHGTTDPATGLLSQDALRTLAPAVLRFAEELGQPVELAMITIDDFATLNEDYGWDYGDEVARSASTCLERVAAPSALPCRWSGSRLAMLSIGGSPSADDLDARLTEMVKEAGTALGKRPVTMTCRLVRLGATEVDDLDALVARATSVPAAELSAPAD